MKALRVFCARTAARQLLLHSSGQGSASGTSSHPVASQSFTTLATPLSRVQNFLPHSSTLLPLSASLPPISLSFPTPLAISSRFESVCSSSSSPPKDGPDSDEDFKPQYRKPEETNPIHKLIEEDVKSNPVMVYMKGTPSMPMCGFSGGVVQILKAYGVDFKSRNVLEDADLRQGIKSFSQWPTIPQVFVNGEFLGGCDILFKMHEDGELEKLFGGVQDKTAA